MPATKNKPNEINILRVYDAPVKMVWDAWTTDQVGHWWGPRGFTITTHSKDIRPGGMWHYTMHGPDGVDYVNKTRYFEVEPFSKMVYDHGGNDEQKPLFRVTVLFKELDGKTHLDMTMALPTAEAAAETRKFIKKANGDSTWDRLAEYLEKGTSRKEIFVINRSFQAPLELMYDLWTRPEHVARWVPPTGFTMKFIEVDMRPGGKSFYSMTDASGQHTMYGKTQYLEFTKPNRIVYTQQFADAKGNVAKHPMAPTWPETMRTTVLLTAEGPEQTRVTVIWEPVDPSAAETDTFIKARSGMHGGWTGSFDKLDEYIPEHQGAAK
ncbi:MAG TPA: SRPBCC family protein [bacterium]|nr:SRPBCC family protein [bacterium]